MASQQSQPQPQSLQEDIGEIDVESLRRIFGSASFEDLNKRKAHELREQWMESVQQQQEQQQQGGGGPSGGSPGVPPSAAGLPRFLLDPRDDRHVAPHALALRLLLGRVRRREGDHGDGLYRRVAASCGNDSESESERDNGAGTGTVAGTIAIDAPFVLEVLGGAGAVWGCAELAGLRGSGAPDSGRAASRTASLVVGAVCLARFLVVRLLVPLRPTRHQASTSTRTRAGFWELARAAAGDPVLALHPSRGMLAGFLRGPRGRDTGGDSGNEIENKIDHEIDHEIESPVGCRKPPSSPPALGGAGGPSPRGSTWDASSSSSDDDYDCCSP
ncbi:unnamed protein product [Pseudo-nitzschia multistriata]|uniref:Uncharacterized protein n=1 Tax=Pseudo-nitzschia multistriata TaxID=183589 RepID=A0A448ZQS1_9STRA|nr:unnamed protein product [Pseudo-nitzschia multistriata]